MVVEPQVLYLSGANRPGLLTALSAALRDLGLDVNKAIVETDAQNKKVADKFYVIKRGGGKVMKVCPTKPFSAAHSMHDIACPIGFFWAGWDMRSFAGSKCAV